MMFEEFALSVSTVLFFLCTLVVGSVLPSDSADTDAPDGIIVAEAEGEVSSAVLPSAHPSFIVGKWIGNGISFEFQNNGTFIYGEHRMNYNVSGDTVTLEAEIDGDHLNKTLKYEHENDRTLKLDGITFFRTNQS